MARTLKYVYLFAFYFMFTFLADATDQSQVHYSATPHSQGVAPHVAHEDVIGTLGFL
jgi:hypothetical protein